MPEITVTVRCNDNKYTIKVDTAKTILEFKEAIAEMSETPVERQRLIYSGRVLKDADTLETYKIAEGHTVHMVKGAARTATPRTEPEPANTATQQPAQPPLANPFEAGGFGGFGGNPFGMGGMGGGMGGMGGLGDAGMMNAMLQDPMFSQTMSAMLQNPQVLESIIAMNPHLGAMGPQLRQMMQSPEFRQILSNPEAIRQMAALSGGLGMGGFGGGAFNPYATNPTTPATTTPATPPTTTAAGNTTSATSPTATGAPAANPFLGLFNPGAATGGANPAAGGLGADQLNFYQQLLSAAALGGGAATTPVAPAQPPEERFQVQLQQLNEMGFYEAQKNIRALLACGGNVNAAIELLVSGNF